MSEGAMGVYSFSFAVKVFLNLLGSILFKDPILGTLKWTRREIQERWNLNSITCDIDILRAKKNSLIRI